MSGKKAIPRLTALEIEAVLIVAGNADAPATFEAEPDNRKAARLLAAYERGTEKLRVALAALTKAGAE